MKQVNKNIFLILLFVILLIGLTSALQESMGTFKQGNVVRLTQVCSDASYINISSVSYPDSSVALSETQMNSIGSGEFYFDFNDTVKIGRYNVRGVSNGCDFTFSTYFDITPSGNSGAANIVFVIFIIIAIYTITLIGFFGKVIPLTVIGGMAMIFLGLYLINNGIIIYRDDLTLYFSYLTTGIGFILAMWASYEWYQDM